MDTDTRRAEERGQSSLGRGQLGDRQRSWCKRRGRRQPTASLHTAAAAAGVCSPSVPLGRPASPASAAAAIFVLPFVVVVVVTLAAFSLAAALRSQADRTGRRWRAPPLPDVYARHGAVQGTEHDSGGRRRRGGNDGVGAVDVDDDAAVCPVQYDGGSPGL